MPDPNSYQVGGSHYQGEYTQQHWDYAWERQFDQFQYVITKYVERHKKKNGIEDLRKAQHYLAKYIGLVEAGLPENPQWTEEQVANMRELSINTEHQNNVVTNTPRPGETSSSRYRHVGPDLSRHKTTEQSWDR